MEKKLKLPALGLAAGATLALLAARGERDMRMSAVEKYFVNRPGHAANVARHALDLVARTPIEKGEAYLDVGCGTGAAAREVAARFGLRVTGVDIDPAQIAEAARGLAQPNLTFLTMDATRLAFPNASFDVVATSKATHHIPDWERAIAEMARVLRPGGHLIYSDLVLPVAPRQLPSSSRLEAVAKRHGLIEVYRARSFAVLDLIWRKSGS
ncbi:MAG: class I SAM-dependent methyltransferase [Bryobacterales bacterium]|nr:class I SAM-dependent methyltransferase [Bryobacterales bacterium]